MTLIDLGLHLVVALAAMLQAITGIGFALIAGPVILLVTDSAAGIQVSAFLSLLIAIVLVPSMRAHVDLERLKQLLPATVLALPLGVVVQAAVGIVVLKLLAALVLVALLFSLLRARTLGRSSSGDWMAGGLAGFLGGCLAMPGPPIASRLTSAGIGKQASRATVLALFIAVYPLILLIQGAATGIDVQTLATTAVYTPATLAGTLAGHLMEPRVDEALYRRMVMVCLAIIALSLAVASAGALLRS